MKIIIPMAGMGKRMRPHTLTVPKPLINLAGKTIVQRLVESVSASLDRQVDEIAYVIGDFGEEVEQELINIAEKSGAEGKIFYQDEPLGTAHAIACAEESLDGPVVVAFADTLFKADFSIDAENDAVIWINKVDDPSAFGVVITDDEGKVTAFEEKPENFVSDKAIIGIYYFKSGEGLRKRIRELIKRGDEKNGEYQLTDVLQEMLEDGIQFKTAEVEEWLDCGNKAATVFTHQRILEFEKDLKQISPKAYVASSVIIPPTYIADGARISNSVIGPHVSVGKDTIIEHSVITDSIIQESCTISDANFDHCMVGNNVEYKGNVSDVSLGDYSVIN